MNGRERILDFVRGGATDCLPCMPITMMFASDFAGARYISYATDHRVQVAGQLKLADHFGLDHVSVISDPACEAADCGADVTFFEDAPPAFKEEGSLLRDKSALGALRAPSPHRGERMANRIQAVRELAAATGRDRVVEGWVEGPCGQSANLRGINRLMLDFYDDPDFVHELVDFVVEMEVSFGRAQIDAGAELIGIGDPATSLIGPARYHEFIWPAQQRVIDAIHGAGAMTRLHICGDNSRMLPAMARLGCDIIDVDSKVPMAVARQAVGPDQVLVGNLDPVRRIHDGTPETVLADLEACHADAGPKHIVGGGCEIPRGTPAANFQALVSFARRHGRPA
jgi:MtaA/CmuA family methyltransferase